MLLFFQFDHLRRGDCSALRCVEIQRAHPDELVSRVAQALAGDVVDIGNPAGKPVVGESMDEHGIVDAVEEETVALLAFRQGFFRTLALGDVARNAEGPDDGAALVAQGHLRGQYPGVGPFGPGFPFFLVDDGLAGLNDLLLVFECFARVFFREEIKIGLADRIRCAPEIEEPGMRPAHVQEAAFPVLEIDLVRQVFFQRIHQAYALLGVVGDRGPGGRCAGVLAAQEAVDRSHQVIDAVARLRRCNADRGVH